MNAVRTKLVKRARQARLKAYAPYSRFLVGAAVLCGSGRVYTGCNIENASYGLSICAERVAFSKAVSCGEREFLSAAVVTEADEPTAPCGACRQFMAEFGTDLDIIMATTSGKTAVSKLFNLLPRTFGPKSLQGEGK